MKRSALISLWFCFFALSMHSQAQDPFTELRALNEKIGAVTDPFYKAQLDYLVGCIENATVGLFPFSIYEKYIDAYLCHVEYLASHTPASQHLGEAREIMGDLVWDWFLLSTFMDPPTDPDPPPDPPDPCKVRILQQLGDTLGWNPGGKFQTKKHKHRMVAEGSPPGGMYTWSMEPEFTAAFFSKDERATITSFNKGEWKVKVVYTVDGQSCEDMLSFIFR